MRERTNEQTNERSKHARDASLYRLRGVANERVRNGRVNNLLQMHYTRTMRYTRTVRVNRTTVRVYIPCNSPETSLWEQRAISQ